LLTYFRFFSPTHQLTAQVDAKSGILKQVREYKEMNQPHTLTHTLSHTHAHLHTHSPWQQQKTPKTLSSPSQKFVLVIFVRPNLGHRDQMLKAKSGQIFAKMAQKLPKMLTLLNTQIGFPILAKNYPILAKIMTL